MCRYGKESQFSRDSAAAKVLGHRPHFKRIPQLALLGRFQMLFFGKSRSRSKRQREAGRQFVDELPELVEQFRSLASTTGSPRGLIWKATQAVGPPLFAANGNGQIAAFTAIEVEFDAADDGEMDDAPGLAMVRSATAIFDLRDGRWMPRPPAVFNFGPEDVIGRMEGWEVIELAA